MGSSLALEYKKIGDKAEFKNAFQLNKFELFKTCCVSKINNTV